MTAREVMSVDEALAYADSHEGDPLSDQDCIAALTAEVRSLQEQIRRLRSPEEQEPRSPAAHPVFDMDRSLTTFVPEAAVEAALKAPAGAWRVEDMFTDGDEAAEVMRLALTAALPHLGASAACDDIHPDVDALRRNAERYRFLCDPQNAIEVGVSGCISGMSNRIDAALAAQAGKQGGG